MSEIAILVPKVGDEPPQRKRKLGSSSSASASASASVVPIKKFSAVNYDSCWDDDYIDPLVEEEYHRQFVESDGFDVDYFPLPYGGLIPHILKDKYDYSYDIGLFGRLGLHCFNLEKGTSLKLIGINKYNNEMIGRFMQYYITLEAVDTSNNSLCSFQTCVCPDFIPQSPSFMVLTEIARLKVPSGPQTTPTGLDRRWEDESVFYSHKRKLPKWLTEEELATVSNKENIYELQGNEWLHLYAEFAFYMKWYGKRVDLRAFLPLEMKKIIVQTQENKEASVETNMKASNAIFYISFKGNGDPSGTPVEYQAIIRRTMDGKPGHICLVGECLAYKSS